MFFGKKGPNAVDALLEEKESLINEINLLKSQCRDLQTEISNKNDEIISLKNRLTPYIDAMEHLSLIYSPESQIAYDSYDNLKDIWNFWDSAIHENDEQKKRQERARAINYTPISLDAISAKATFRGNETDYTTTLISCTCMDFQRHARPCKHMYRLAYELNVFYLDDVHELPKGYTILNLLSLKKIINSLPKGQYEILYYIFSSDEPVVLQKTATIMHLLKNRIIQIASNNELFMSSFTKDELLSHMPNGYKKSISKKALVIDIINNYPSVVEEFQNFYIAVEPAITVSHLIYPATQYLESLL